MPCIFLSHSSNIKINNKSKIFDCGNTIIPEEDTRVRQIILMHFTQFRHCWFIFFLVSNELKVEILVLKFVKWDKSSALQDCSTACSQLLGPPPLQQLCGIFGSVIPGLRTFLIVVSSSVRLQLREIQHFLQALVPTQSHQGFNIKSQTGSFLNNISTFFTRLGSNTISSKFELQKTDWLCPKQNFRLRFWVLFYLRLES